MVSALLSITAAILANVSLVLIFIRRIRDQMLLCGVCVAFLLQSVWLLFFVVVNGPTVIINSTLAPDLAEAPHQIFLSLVLLPLIATGVGFLFRRRRFDTFALVYRLKIDRNQSLDWFLGLTAAGSFFYYLSRVVLNDSPLISSVLAYCSFSFAMIPVLIGYLAAKYRIALYGFLASLAVAGIYALAGGSRSLLFLPLAYLSFGFWLSKPTIYKTVLGIAAVIISIPVLYVSALIETVRKEGVVDVNTRMLARVVEIQDLAANESRRSSIIDGLAQGLGRMVVWSNFVSFLESPRRVPHAGYIGLADELKFISQSSVFRESTDYLNEMLEQDSGIGASKIFGFQISAGGSVPFPILAESWWRGGLLAASVAGIILCAFWALSERLVQNVFKADPRMVAVITFILLSSSYDRMNVYGIVYNLKYLLMQLVLWVGCFSVARRFSRSLNRPDVTNHY